MGCLSHDCLTLHRSLSYQQKFSSLEIRGPVEEPHKERSYSCVCVCAQLCLTLCDSMDCSLQAPLSMEIPKQEYWSGLPFPPSGDLPDPGINPASLVSPVWQVNSLVVANGQSGSATGRILLDQGLNLCLLHWQVDSLPLSPQGRQLRAKWKIKFRNEAIQYH